MRTFGLLFFALALSSCVTPYQKSGMTGGYEDDKINETVYKVVFQGNGNTTNETVQTYWLYRASELTIEKGYDYFEIANSLMSGLEFWRDGYESVLVAQIMYIPMQTVAHPKIEREIKLYKKPFTAKPPKSFDARKLLSVLEPLVKGKKCKDQVCPHEKTYLK